MPLYDYKCTKCGTVREIRHGFEETYEEPCAACGAALTRVFSAAPIVFKGSGFYATDSRAKSETKSESAPAETTSEKKADTTSEAKAETKPQAPSGGKSESAA